MRRTNFWVLGILVAVTVAGIAAANSVLAEEPVNPRLDLRALEPAFPLGGTALLQVSVPPYAVGGYANLYATVEGLERSLVMSFPLNQPRFRINAPVPSAPEYLGLMLTYQYEAFSSAGQPLGLSVNAARPVQGPDLAN